MAERFIRTVLIGGYIYDKMFKLNFGIYRLKFARAKKLSTFPMLPSEKNNILSNIIV